MTTEITDRAEAAAAAEAAGGGKEMKPREVAFVDYLEALAARDDRAALARLRRGLGKTLDEARETHRYVMPWLRNLRRKSDELGYFTVATLFALYPERSWRRPEGDRRPTNMGASLAVLTFENQDGSAGVERRFNAMLDGDREALPDHLRYTITLIKNAGVAVDWERLIRDINQWEHPERFVQTAWSRAFWGATPEDFTEESTIPEEE